MARIAIDCVKWHTVSKCFVNENKMGVEIETLTCVHNNMYNILKI